MRIITAIEKIEKKLQHDLIMSNEKCSTILRIVGEDIKTKTIKMTIKVKYLRTMFINEGNLDEEIDKQMQLRKYCASNREESIKKGISTSTKYCEAN